MKKILLACGAAVMLTAVTSCGNSASEADKTGLGDSMAMIYGQMQASGLAQYYNSLSPEEQANFSKDDFLKGMKETLFADTTSQAYSIGQSAGMKMLSEIVQIERNTDVRINRQMLFDYFKKTLNTDSASMPDVQDLQRQMQSLFAQVQKLAQEKYEADAMAKPEVQKSIKEGKAYVDGLKKADSTIKTTSSGLSYKVVNEGQGAKVQATDRVKLKYVGKHANGEEFDSSKGEAVTMSPAAVIPGFSEGLKMMNKGAKYILYIPGDLGYGVQGQPQAGIQPMETLVFEVEVVDIEEPQNIQVQANPNAPKPVEGKVEKTEAKTK